MVAFLPFLSLASLLLSTAAALHVFDSDLTAYETATLSWEEGTAPYVVDIIPSGSSGSVLATLTNSTWDTSIDWFVDIDAGISVTVSVKDAAGENAYSSSLTVADAVSNSTSSVAESSSLADFSSSAAAQASSFAWSSEAASTTDDVSSSASAAAATESSSAADDAPTTISGLATSSAASTSRSSSARSSSPSSASSAAASASASAAGNTSSGSRVKVGAWTLTAVVVLVGSLVAA